MWIYLGLELLVLAGPGLVWLLWKKPVCSLHRLVIGVIAGMVVMIPWDIWFTQTGIWGFNPEFLLGWYVWELPIEEWLFFVVIPLATLLSYQLVKDHLSRVYTKLKQSIVFLLLSCLGLGVLILGWQHWYSLVISLSFVATIVVALIRLPKWLFPFWLTMLILTMPFIVINGVLTGMFNYGGESIVWYNPSAIIGIKLGTIPLEDWLYMYTLAFINVWGYEEAKQHLG